jgi:hypothetical protein
MFLGAILKSRQFSNNRKAAQRRSKTVPKIGRFHARVIFPARGCGLARGVAKAPQALKASRKQIKLPAARAALWIARNHDIEPDRSL